MVKQENNIPRGPQGPLRRYSKTTKTRSAIRATLAIQITLLMTEIWEEICDEGFDADSTECLVSLFVKHGLAERVGVTQEEKDEFDVDHKHQLRLEMAAVRGKAVKWRNKRDDFRRKQLTSP